MGKASRKKRTSFNDDLKKTSGRVASPTTGVKMDIVYKPIIHVLLIIVLGLITYSNTFHVPFQFDDTPNIQNNPIIKDLKYFVKPSNAEGFLFYAPLKIRFIGYLSFALNYKLHGLNVTGYHIFNLAIHIINALLVYWIVVLTFKTSAIKPSPGHNQRVAALIALFSALLFVSHPIQTQAVTYIVQRLASLTAMFYLFSVASYIKSRLSMESHARYTFYTISFISAILAMKTKEIAFTLPVMITMYEIMFFDRKLMKRILYLAPLLLTMTIIALTYLSLHTDIRTLINDVSEVTRVQTSMPRLDYLFTEVVVIVTYIRLLFLPMGQNLDYDYPIYHSFFVPQVFLSFLFLASLMILGIFILLRYRKSAPHTRLISFGIFWFFLALSVESSIIPIEDVIFEHRVYLPFVGASIAIVTCLFAAMNALEHYRTQIGRYMILVCVSIIIVFSGIAYSRNGTWQNQLTLWSDVVEKSPNKARPHNNLGVAYSNKGLYDQAVEQYQMALSQKPDYTDAHNNLGVAYSLKGLSDKAIEQYQMALSLKPDYAEAHNNLGQIYKSKGLSSKAIEQYEIALSLQPDFVQAHYNLAFAYMVEGLYDQAIEQYQMTLSLQPDYLEAHNNLGTIYHTKGLYDKAIEQYQTVLSLKPDYAMAHNNLGNAYNLKGLIDKAIEQYQMAVSLKPDYMEAHYNLGTVYQSKGLYDKAIEQYQMALSLKPDYAMAHNNLGNAYNSKGLIDKAIEQYQIALKLEPNSPESHFNVGVVYLNKGDMALARREFEAVLRIKPNDYKAQRILNDILHRPPSP